MYTELLHASPKVWEYCKFRYSLQEENDGENNEQFCLSKKQPHMSYSSCFWQYVRGTLYIV